MIVRARSTDPNPPRARVWAVRAVGTAAVLAGLFAGLGAMPFFSGLALLALGSRWLRRAPFIPVDLHVAPGRVEVRSGGARLRTLRAREVRAASTARVEGGVAVALQVRGEVEPVIFDLPSDDAADALRTALGVGHGGAGTLRWPAASAMIRRARAVGRAAAALGWLSLLAIVQHSAPSPVSAFVGTLGMFALMAAAVCALFWRALAFNAHVVLQPSGVGVRTWDSWAFVPYHRVRGVRQDARGLLIDSDTGTVHAPLGDGAFAAFERAHVAAQILSAADRARGRGALPKTTAARLARLAADDEPRRAWLARVDATADQLAHAGGYRGIDIAEVDLWQALEDPDTPADVRAASARILARVSAAEDARARIDTALETVREDAVRTRIRVALASDPDDAARALEELDAAPAAWARRAS